MSATDLKFLGASFGLPGDFQDAGAYGSGHINDTFLATYSESGTRRRYIHQRINRKIFQDPAALMENIVRVTDHAREVLGARGVTDSLRRVLTVIPTLDGKPLLLDEEGQAWRTYRYIEDSVAYDRIETPQQAFDAARAFGKFQELLAYLPGARLHETITNFHHTRERFHAFKKAMVDDRNNRAGSACEEIFFAESRENIVDVLLDLQASGELPERVTHNDTKLNNVLFDRTTGEALCVIDLDTVMPGLVLYDFGDMVRTATSPADEDGKDLSKVHMQMVMFEALARGYLESTRAFLTEAEKAQLAFSGKLISFETGLRFLTDHLQGDTYFKIKYPGHNLDRCRTQFQLVRSIEKQEESMNRFVDSL